MYSTYNERKSVAAESFIRTIKSKIFKHMTAVSKNVYFDVLSNIVDKYNNTVHRTIRMKPIDVTLDSYAEYNEDSNKKILNSKLVIMLEFQNTKAFLHKGFTQKSSEELFVVSKIQNTSSVDISSVISDLNGEPITGSFYGKKIQKTNQEQL